MWHRIMYFLHNMYITTEIQQKHNKPQKPQASHCISESTLGKNMFENILNFCNYYSYYC